MMTPWSGHPGQPGNPSTIASPVPKKPDSDLQPGITDFTNGDGVISDPPEFAIYFMKTRRGQWPWRISVNLSVFVAVGFPYQISYWAQWCFDMTVASTYWLIYSSINTSRSSRSLRSFNTRPQALMSFLPVPVFEIRIWTGGPGVWSLWWIPRVLLASITHQALSFASFRVWSWTVIATMQLVKVVPEIAIVKGSLLHLV